jgi:hypothetical protein
MAKEIKFSEMPAAQCCVVDLWQAVKLHLDQKAATWCLRRNSEAAHH